MPTNPEPAHRHRRIAESFGADAARYDRTRPRYPDALIDRLLSAIATDPTAGTSRPPAAPEVLDVGIGTGIGARQLQAAGAVVLGVEPDPRMADFARRHGTPTDIATFEDWDPADRRFDAVIAGQSWHWVDPRAGAAKAAAVLRPGGRFAAFWNAGQLPADLFTASREVYERCAPDHFVTRAYQTTVPAAALYTSGFAKVEEALRHTAAFTEPERWTFPWQHTYTTETWLDVFPTHGGHDLLPPDTLAAIADGIAAAVDRLGGGFVMDYTALAVTALRVS